MPRPHRPRGSRALRAGTVTLPVALAVVLAALVLGGCSEQPTPPNTDPEQVDAVEAPELGACRKLTTEEVAAPTNATQTVPCDQRHNAQTYAVGTLPDQLQDADPDDPAVGAFAYDTCSTKFRSFVGADESLELRTVLSWAWFGPSDDAWAEGARWYRCDVVGGNEQTSSLYPLPETAERLLAGGRPEDRWLMCVAGTTVSGTPKTPCSRKHDWRAVTTIKLGEPTDPYPGDSQVEATTKDFCSDSVGAWLNYPVDYEFAYTWFHEPEWTAGNRRSVCWARTTQ